MTNATNIIRLVDDRVLLDFMRAIDAGQGADAYETLRATPSLVTAQVERGATRGSSGEFFLPACLMHIRSGSPSLTLSIVSDAAEDLSDVKAVYFDS